MRLPVDIAGGEAETKVIKDRVVVSAILVTFDVKCAGGLDFRVNERTELRLADSGHSIVGKPAFPGVSVGEFEALRSFCTASSEDVAIAREASCGGCPGLADWCRAVMSSDFSATGGSAPFDARLARE